MTAADDRTSAGEDVSGAPAADTPERRGPTAAQLRRFIKSRPYVPLHELRRRFELNGDLDDVCAIEGQQAGRVFIGLPEREAGLIESLCRDGEVGLELSRDPGVPIVVGVFAMRPVSRS
jgi:hypothetical protein